MAISVKCYASLSGYQPENSESFPLGDSETVRDVMQRIGLDAAEVKLAFVNGKHAGFDHVLRDGDKVAFFPAVGGG
jgi:molybdopterin converting factor small subunit